MGTTLRVMGRILFFCRGDASFSVEAQKGLPLFENVVALGYRKNMGRVMDMKVGEGGRKDRK